MQMHPTGRRGLLLFEDLVEELHLSITAITRSESGESKSYGELPDS